MSARAARIFQWLFCSWQKKSDVQYSIDRPKPIATNPLGIPETGRLFKFMS
jgi:hypothetical protein